MGQGADVPGQVEPVAPRQLTRTTSFLKSMVDGDCHVDVAQRPAPSGSTNILGAMLHQLSEVHRTRSMHAGMRRPTPSMRGIGMREISTSSSGAKGEPMQAPGVRSFKRGNSLTTLTAATLHANPALYVFIEQQKKASHPTCIEEVEDENAEFMCLNMHGDLQKQKVRRGGGAVMLPTLHGLRTCPLSAVQICFSYEDSAFNTAISSRTPAVLPPCIGLMCRQSQVTSRVVHRRSCPAARPLPLTPLL